MTLAERIAQAKANPITPTILETKVEALSEEGISIPLSAILVPYDDPKPVSRSENRSFIRAMALSLAFTNTAFKSRAQYEFGEFVEGVSIDIMGHDLECDTEGNPLLVTEEITDEAGDKQTITKTVMMTEDEEGNPLEPKVLMSFRPQWGVDYSRNASGSPKGKNMLNLVPSRGVPRKESTEVNLEGDEKKKRGGFDAPVDWSLIPSLQTDIERVLLNNEDPRLKEWIASIPVASNAPSTQTAQGSVTGTPRVSVGGGQAFASAPEDKNPFGLSVATSTEGTKPEETKPEDTSAGKGSKK